jgi:hypothetical protein
VRHLDAHAGGLHIDHDADACTGHHRFARTDAHGHDRSDAHGHADEQSDADHRFWRHKHSDSDKHSDSHRHSCTDGHSESDSGRHSRSRLSPGPGFDGL